MVPGTADFIAFHAAYRPDHPAVEDRGLVVSYRQFHADIARVIQALAAIALPADSFVAVEWDGLYRHWLLLLALEARGVASHSYASESRSGVTETITGMASAVFHSKRIPTKAKATLAVDDAWWDAVLAQPEPDPATQQLAGHPPGRLLRIVSSSGTTAEAKLMAPTAAQMEAQRLTCLWLHQFAASSRYLVGKGFFLQADYRRACCCLRAGGTVVYGDDLPVAEALAAARPTHVALLPMQIEALAAQNDTRPGFPRLTLLAAIGGRVPPALRQRLLDTVTDDLLESYGANETGSIATMDAAGLGTPVPGMRVMVVDDADQPVAVGEAGHIRVQGPGCVTRYQFNNALTAQRFRDGWFYPGDTGSLTPDHQLRLIGRSDDLLNFGGLKINAPDQEQLYKTIPGVVDVALTSKPDARGVEIPYIVVVKQDGYDTETIKSALTQHGVGLVNSFALVFTDAIPRTETGKIRRNFLRAELAKR